MDFDQKLVYKADGISIDHKLSNFEDIEDMGIKYLNLVKELQTMVDSRLDEGMLVSHADKAKIEKIEE